MSTLPVVGERYRVAHEVWRYPHFIVEEGATGMIVESDDELVALKLDEVIEGAEEWQNELHWYPNNCDDDPWEDLVPVSQDPEKEGPGLDVALVLLLVGIVIGLIYGVALGAWLL